MRDEHIGRVIGEYRKRKMTQGVLAEKLETSISTISDIENGKKKISGEDLVRICKALEVPLLDVVDRSFLSFRNEMIELGGDGGWLLGPPVTLADIESGVEDLTGNFNNFFSKYLRFVHPPTEIEELRSSLRKAPARDDALFGQERGKRGSRKQE